jgi:hypothetical protein
MAMGLLKRRGDGMSKMFDLREPSIEALRDAPVYFRYGSNKRRVLVDHFTASAVLAVYDALNGENQAKLRRMVAGTFGQFNRVVDFAFKSVKAA